MTPVPSKPAEDYRDRRQQRQAAHAALAQLDEQLSRWRLAVFAVGALVTVFAWRGTIAPVWLLLPGAAFLWLVVRHERTIHARGQAARAVEFYERGLARIEDRWPGLGETGERFRDDHHPYANDLDLFGRGSLFELLSSARTNAGEEILAAWLKEAADPDTLRARHEAVRELTPEVDLREALWLAGGDVRAHLHPDALVAWAEAPAAPPSGWHHALAATMSLLTLAAAAIWFAGGSIVPLLLTLMVQGTYHARRRRHIEVVLHAANASARDLEVLLHAVLQLERHRFTTERLSELRRSFDTPGAAASTLIRRVHRYTEMHDWEHNIVFAPVAALLMWSTHLAWAVERWRHHHGNRVGQWLRAVGEVEALSSLAAYRYEHPDDPFPDIVASEHATFDGMAVGHPLLPDARMVRNDVHLGGAQRLLVISGSNMSGKSTLLRTVGINAVLALCGAPVRAASLRVSVVTVGATLRIQDSLQEGRSRFYAEITRIRHLAQLAEGPRPLLFLLDELFHGTNSHDRLVGASGVLRSLLDRGAIGLVTTHDLALTAVSDQLAPRAMNVHFEDRFERGEMQFDYRMKPGPVTHSNAIALMRAVGLAVDDAGLGDS